MKIYTRTGDAGQTALFGGQRVSKAHARVEAYGDVDELNALLGLAIVTLEAAGDLESGGRLQLLQGDLFTLGANLAAPGPEDGGRKYDHIPPLPTTRVAEMEGWMDAAEDELPPLRNFILPGGTEAAARLHLARTVCRRAERRTISLAATAHLDPAVTVYLNRLSDLLFTLARIANHRAERGDIEWTGTKMPVDGT